MSLLLCLSALASAATVHVDADTAITVYVGEDSEDLKPRRTADFKRLDEGTHHVQVFEAGQAVWVGELGIPDKAEVWLVWNAGSLAIAKADRETSGLERVANTASTVAAGAQAASDVAGAGSAASSDMQAVSKGTATESSHTEISVSGGPNGLQTDTSRTTAGASGVHHEAASTSMGPDGVSRSTSSMDMTQAGVTAEKSSVRVSRVRIPGKGDLVVTLSQVGGASAPSVASSPAPVAAVAPTPAATAVPNAKKVVFKDPDALTADGVAWRFLDPVADEGMFKVQIRLRAPADRVVVWDPATSVVVLNGREIWGRAKVLSVGPERELRRTVVFEDPGAEHRAEAATLMLGSARLFSRQDRVAMEALDVDAGVGVAGDLACEVTRMSVSKKGAAGTVDCTNRGDQWLWVAPSEADLVVAGAAVPNTHKKHFSYVLGPGESGEIALSTAVRGDVTHVVFSDVFFTAAQTPMGLAAVSLEIDVTASKW
ncbi:MAG: hypothetical protein KC912_17570 [Proteobacteria bacterium]|nr:hypothetical protein [Pseudomonadota bacterium]